ncbi:hypothetical protein JCM18237_01450 [Halorubrum luteum]
MLIYGVRDAFGTDANDGRNMSLHPRRYDVRELRSLAGQPRAAADGAPRERTLRQPNRSRAEHAARSAAFTELLQRQRGLRQATDGDRPSLIDGDRPYLTEIPATPDAEHEIGEWLGYLVDVGGHLRSRDALSYYTELGWIAPDVADVLERRLHGFESPRHDRPFIPADHRISLVSLVRLVSCASDHERR